MLISDKIFYRSFHPQEKLPLVEGLTVFSHRMLIHWTVKKSKRFNFPPNHSVRESLPKRLHRKVDQNPSSEVRNHKTTVQQNDRRLSPLSYRSNRSSTHRRNRKPRNWSPWRRIWKEQNESFPPNFQQRRQFLSKSRGNRKNGNQTEKGESFHTDPREEGTQLGARQTEYTIRDFSTAQSKESPNNRAAEKRRNLQRRREGGADRDWVNERICGLRGDVATSDVISQRDFQKMPPRGGFEKACGSCGWECSAPRHVSRSETSLTIFFFFFSIFSSYLTQRVIIVEMVREKKKREIMDYKNLPDI